MTAKIGMVSLGCPKNQIDAEQMLARLADAGFEITSDEAQADAVIVNTCGFIEEAKTEAIENILEVAAYKTSGSLKALIVTGCLAERYRDEITSLIPEVDLVVGIGRNAEIVSLVSSALEGKTANAYAPAEDLLMDGGRILTTPPYTAYLKVADGCDNCCTYCAIPAIRGRFRSRPMEEVLAEARRLAVGGVKELIVVAQDTTGYGADLYGEPKLAELLQKLCEIEGLHWIRTLYTYPDRITDRLLDTIAGEEKLVPYLDIPLQHCDGEILRRMNRTGDRESLTALLSHIRAKLPGVTLRTTLITGFPGEDEAAFTSLAEFVREIRFDRLGCFAYSAEEGTPAADFPDQVEAQVRQDRMENIMNDQLTISAERNAEKQGKTLEVLVEGYDSYIRCYFGRSAADAPDIDGKVFFLSPRPLEVGSFVLVRINDTIEYDLLGELV
ncbi:MAG: 30S ribosomal protein S12 methylthiotransferase RimO [Candidatus Howiella sp.]|jgi:ribosomal protein S12 methylthiotransferase